MSDVVSDVLGSSIERILERLAGQMTYFSILALALSALVPSMSASAEEQAMEEIVVTALKRDQTLQEVPIAVSVLGSEDLQELGIEDMTDIQYAVPSLHFSEYLGRANVTIRGVGDFQDAPGVAVGLDGVYQPTSVTAKLAQLDLERIEVVRGPQGTLHGRNSNAGAVNFVSKAPSHQAGGYVRAGYAEYEEFNLTAAYGASITESTTFRIAVDHTDANEGWIKNLSPGQDDLQQGRSTSFRLRLKSELSDDATLDLMYAGVNAQGAFSHTSIFTDERFLTDPIVQTTTASFEPHETYSPTENKHDRDLDLFSASLKWDLGTVTLDSITSYQTFDEQKTYDGGAYDLSIFDIVNDSQEIKTFTQEIRLSGQSEAFDWIVGAYYMDIDWARENHRFLFPLGFAGLPPGASLVYNTPVYDSRSTAFFVDGTWNVNDHTRISLGARYTKEELEFESLQTVDIAPGLVIPNCDRKVDTDDNPTTIRAAFQRDMSENGSFYVSYSEGFKVGGFSIFECNAAYDPEEINSWEVGTKWVLGNGATTLSAAAFYYDYVDFQVAQVIDLGTVTRNAGDAKIQGLEVELDAFLNESWSFSGGLTLLDSEYEDFVNFDGLNPAAGFQQLKGNRLNKTPEVSLNLGFAYRTALANGSSLTIRADGAYRSRTYFREFNAREDSQDAYTIVNLNVIWNSEDGAWSGRLYASNLTDEEYVQDITGDVTTGGRFGQWGMPRQVGVKVTRFFD